MAYETNHPAWPAFTVKFARSKDLVNWTVDGEALLGTDRYAACPCIRYANGYYYVLYLEQRKPRWFFEVYAARSRDLRKWESSGTNPVLTPDGQTDGINASDADLCELDGKTYLYYSVGDQRTWMNIRRAVYDGPMNKFLAAWFPIPGIPTK
jgi:beta-xylosidase